MGQAKLELWISRSKTLIWEINRSDSVDNHKLRFSWRPTHRTKVLKTIEKINYFNRDQTGSSTIHLLSSRLTSEPHSSSKLDGPSGGKGRKGGGGGGLHRPGLDRMRLGHGRARREPWIWILPPSLPTSQTRHKSVMFSYLRRVPDQVYPSSLPPSLLT